MPSHVSSVLTQVAQVVHGKEHEIKLALTCLLAKGHLLIEDLPGMGKTTLAHTLALSLGLSYQRMQFTSDLLPADILGVSVFDSDNQEFTLHPGPIFNQVVLADEINRASPKTQSALLEAMEECQVSIDGKTHKLPMPFFVIATQNPLFHSGTYPLPESQLDRFMMRLSLGFPDTCSERKILMGEDSATVLKAMSSCLTTDELCKLQDDVTKVHCESRLVDYVIALCQRSRESGFSGNPLSPRAGKALIACAKAWALIAGRDFVLPDDVQAVFYSVCEHRLDAGHKENINGSISKHLIAQVDVNNPL